MGSKKQEVANYEKEFVSRFNTLCQTRSGWQVWSDVITAIACAIANSTETNKEVKAEREAEYEKCIERLGGMNTPAEMLGLITMALEENPEQDFLGNLFMRLELGSHWHGQFFTPYHICKLMSEINVDGATEQIRDKGYITVNDCACGAGATLIAFANTLRDKKINYQQHALFVAQDIDRIAALMCYIQLSLLGCAGYVVVADSICNPVVCEPLVPIAKENQEFWIMPMFNCSPWIYRRFIKQFTMEFSK